MKHLKTKCKPLDDLLGGGIENKTVTEIYGEAGSGKTNLCLQISRESAINGNKVVYIDTECVSSLRLKQICTGYDYDKILTQILFFNPDSLDEQEKMINDSIEIKDIGLIIVDTFNMFYRIMFEEDEKGSSRSLNRQMTNLQLTARKKNISVVLAGQVYTADNNEIKPFAGRGIEHMVKTIIKLEKISMGKRQATIMKHRSQPEGKKTIFTIAHKGLE